MTSVVPFTALALSILCAAGQPALAAGARVAVIPASSAERAAAATLLEVLAHVDGVDAQPGATTLASIEDAAGLGLVCKGDDVGCWSRVGVIAGVPELIVVVGTKPVRLVRVDVAGAVALRVRTAATADGAALHEAARALFATTGRLVVDAGPAGVTVLVDGTPVGTTPVTMNPDTTTPDSTTPDTTTPERGDGVRTIDLPPGEHRVRAQHEGHVPVDETVTLEAGSTLRLEITLRPDAPLPVPPSETAPDALQTHNEIDADVERSVDDGPSLLGLGLLGVGLVVAGGGVIGLVAGAGGGAYGESVVWSRDDADAYVYSGDERGLWHGLNRVLWPVAMASAAVIVVGAAGAAAGAAVVLSE